MHEYLVLQPFVTVDEAYRAMLILSDGQDGGKTFKQRETTLLDRGIVRRAWGLRADNCIDKGSVAFMACRILKIPGGVDMLVFGSWGPGDRRYAMRELVYRKLLDDAPVYRYISGGELATLLRKADEYMQKQGQYPMEPVDLGEEPRPDRPRGDIIKK